MARMTRTIMLFTMIYLHFCIAGAQHRQTVCDEPIEIDNGVQVSSFRINGECHQEFNVYQGRAVNVDVEYYNPEIGCTNCVEQVYVGIRGQPLECIFHGNPSGHMLDAHTLTISADTAPGTYVIVARTTLAYDCLELTDGIPIATIHVRTPPHEENSCDCSCHHELYVPDERNNPVNDCWILNMGYDRPCCNDYDEYSGEMCRGTDWTATFEGRMSVSDCMERCSEEESCTAFDVDEELSCFLHQTDAPFPVPDSSHVTKCFIKKRNICCEAYTLECQACAENMTEEEYCENFSESDLCHETCDETCPNGYQLYSDYSNVCRNEEWKYCAICHANGLPWKSMDLCSEVNITTTNIPSETCDEVCPYGYYLYSDYWTNVCKNAEKKRCSICHTDMSWMGVDPCSELNITATNSPAKSFFNASGNGCEIVGTCVQTVGFPSWVKTYDECSIRMNRNAFVTYNATAGEHKAGFDTVGRRRDFDHLRTHISFNGGDRSIMPVKVWTLDEIFWSSNESLNIPGWQLCFSDSVITVINASWSNEEADCWSNQNQTLNLRNSCNDTAACAHTLTDNEDPCPYENKSYFAQYTCDGSKDNLREVNVSSVSAGSIITLDCTDTCDCDCHQGYVPDTRQLPASMCWLNGMGYERPCCNALAPPKESSSSSLALFLTMLMVLSF